MFWNIRNRNIFKYYDGVKVRYGDPLAILNKIDTHPVYNAEKHPKLAQSSDKAVSVQAYQICVDCFRQAFNCPDFDDTTGRGLTMQEVITLNELFCKYCDDLKKNISNSSTPLD